MRKLLGGLLRFLLLRRLARTARRRYRSAGSGTPGRAGARREARDQERRALDHSLIAGAAQTPRPLLTAFLEDRPIYVFDEWAADQDAHYRDIFYTRVLADLRARGKTVVVISHDDRYYHLGDRIVKLEYGQLLDDRRPVR